MDPRLHSPCEKQAWCKCVSHFALILPTHPKTELAGAAWEQGPSVNHSQSPEARLKQQSWTVLEWEGQGSTRVPECTCPVQRRQAATGRQEGGPGNGDICGFCKKISVWLHWLLVEVRNLASPLQHVGSFHAPRGG